MSLWIQIDQECRFSGSRQACGEINNQWC
jgi:hypothetical protein